MSSPGSRLQTDTPSALQPGTRLGEFELLSLLGVGGFGIVYLAFDHALEREVAVKEYMPASLAGRTETMHVSLRSQSDAETFALGLKSFVNEARLLARFDHPSLLKVLRFWEGNGTAYMAMPVMRGRTVKEVRLDMSNPPDEAWLRALLEPLLGAIERLHSEGVYHRDIAPDNIQIEPDGHPVLLDFGAARRVISDKSQTLTAILKPAYAPIEQYAEAGSVKQGPWTDIYALGATLHFLLLGRPPPPATARAIHDDASALTTLSLPNCSQNFLHIVDWMLAPRPADRPQNVAALRDVLAGRTLPPQRRAPESNASQWDRTVRMSPAHASTGTPGDDQATVVMPSSTLPGGAVATPAAPTARPPAPAPVVPAPVAQTPAPPPVPPAAPAVTPVATSRRPKLLPVVLGLGAVVVGAAVVFWPKAPATVAVAPAASAAAPAEQLLPPAAPVAASSVPESAITTVLVRPPPAEQNINPPTIAAPGAGASVAAGKPVRPAQVVRPVAPSTTTAATVLPPQPQAEAPKPVAEAAPPPAAPTVPAPTLVEAPRPVATGPEAKCGSRNPLSYFVCMERECLRTENVPHADCQKWRRAARNE